MDRLTYFQRLVDRSDKLRDSLSRTAASLVTGITLVLSMQIFVIQSVDQDARSQARTRAASAAVPAGQTAPHLESEPRITTSDVICELVIALGLLVAALALVFAIGAMWKANGIFLSWRRGAVANPDGKTIGNVTHGLGSQAPSILDARNNEPLTREELTEVVTATAADLRDATASQEQGQMMLIWSAIALLASPCITILALMIRYKLASG